MFEQGKGGHSLSHPCYRIVWLSCIIRTSTKCCDDKSSRQDSRRNLCNRVYNAGAVLKERNDSGFRLAGMCAYSTINFVTV
jgi:hypothetical protein